MRRIAAVVIAVTGLFLIAVPFALRLFERAGDAEQVTERFRPMMSDEGLVQLRSDFETVKAGGTEFINDAIPRFADDLGMTDTEFAAFTEENFPNVATGVEQIPGIVDFVDPVLTTLEDDTEEFDSADSIPVGDIPITVGPWVFLGLGAALVAAGAVILRGSGSGPLVATALLSAVVVVVAPFVVRFPQKADDGEDLAAVARIGLAQDGAHAAQSATVVLDDMVIEVRGEMLPALGDALDLTDAELGAVLAEDYPAIDRLLADWDDIVPRGYALASNQQASVDDFADADALSFQTIPWLLAVPGAVALVAAGTLLLAGRRVRRIPDAAEGRVEVEPERKSISV